MTDELTPTGRVFAEYVLPATAGSQNDRFAFIQRAESSPAFVTDHKWVDSECHASGCQTLILKAEIEKLREQKDKYMWQVRDTCARAEKAEAFLAELSADYKALLEYCGAESIMEIRDGYMKYKDLCK